MLLKLYEKAHLLPVHARTVTQINSPRPRLVLHVTEPGVEDVQIVREGCSERAIRTAIRTALLMGTSFHAVRSPLHYVRCLNEKLHSKQHTYESES